MHRLTTFRLAIVVAALAAILIVQAVAAQHSEPDCDVEALLTHQHEHAHELDSFHEETEADLDAALATLYRTGIAYQALALDCGFVDGEAVEATHEAEHASDGHSEDEAATQLEIALSVGDPAAGEVLFTTFRDEVSFACATCHRVDSTERLIGPGLLGVGRPAHDPAAHADEVDTAVTEEAAEHEEHHEEATAEATAAVERTIEETIAYLHMSIIDPNAYVVPDFPADLMPATYADIFTEEEINNLVAYLLTL